MLNQLFWKKVSVPFLVPFFVLVGWSLAASAEAPFSYETTPGRLPKDIVPLDYQLRIAPDFKSFAFDGSAAIRIKVLKPTPRIVVNALGLRLRSAALSGPDRARTAITATDDPQNQMWTFALDAPLPVGEYTLEMDYTGTIGDVTQGLYHEKYRTSKGERVMLATQMEPADARRMFPGWDEPVFRASFELSTDLPAGMDAYSNMPVAQTSTLPGGKRRIRFERTPRMSSYLVVLVAGELERLSVKKDGVEHGVVTTAGKRQQGDYALAASQQILPFFNDYFGVDYPLPKLDHFAIPSTAGFGAMENWGGIWYNESVLLFDPKTSSDGTRRDIFEVMAHEMAHQWFGDLVTMAWWDNLWLNEGFASWLETKTSNHFNPDWGVWLHKTLAQDRAMNLDARKTTHPIQTPIETESQVNDSFDSITYSKGRAFLRMLEDWLGEEPFRDGLRRYMAQHAYSNTTTADLWAALEAASGKPVRAMANGWVEQPGFPLVSVSAKCVRGSLRIELSQQHFQVDDKPSGRLWNVPVTLADFAGNRQRVMLDKRSLQVKRAGCDAGLVLDPDSTGYYRVEYAPELLKPLTAALPKLPAAARLKILSDAWALTGAGRLQASDYLALLPPLRDEPEPAVWGVISAHLSRLDMLSDGDAVNARLRAFGIGVLRPKLYALGWDPVAGESQQAGELRSKLIWQLGEFGDAEVVAEARKRFHAFLRKPASLNPGIADAVLEVAGRNADKADFDAIERLLLRATSNEERNRYLTALTAVQDPKLAARVLDLSLGKALATGYRAVIPRRVANNRTHRMLAWRFAQAHQDALLALVQTFDRNGYFSSILFNATDADLAGELEAFTRERLPPEAQNLSARSADAIRYNATMRARLLPQLAALPIN